MSIDSKSLQTFLEGVNADPGVTEEDIVRLARHPLGPIPHRCMIEARRFDSPVLGLCLGKNSLGGNGVWVHREDMEGNRIVEGPQGQKVTLRIGAPPARVAHRTFRLCGAIGRTEKPVAQMTQFYSDPRRKQQHFVFVDDEVFRSSHSYVARDGDSLYFTGGSPEEPTLMCYEDGNVRELKAGVPERIFDLTCVPGRVVCVYRAEGTDEPSMKYLDRTSGHWYSGPRMGRIRIHHGAIRLAPFGKDEFGPVPHPDIWSRDYASVGNGRFALECRGKNALGCYGVTDPSKQEQGGHDVVVPAGPGFEHLTRPFFHHPNSKWCYWGALGNVVYLMELDIPS